MKDTAIQVLSDADGAGDRADRKSTTGILLQMRGISIAWKTFKQNYVALYTTEADFMSLSESVTLELWLRCFLEAFGCTQEDSTAIHQDNQGDFVA